MQRKHNREFCIEGSWQTAFPNPYLYNMYVIELFQDSEHLFESVAAGNYRSQTAEHRYKSGSPYNQFVLYLVNP